MKFFEICAEVRPCRSSPLPKFARAEVRPCRSSPVPKFGHPIFGTEYNKWISWDTLYENDPKFKSSEASPSFSSSKSSLRNCSVTSKSSSYSSSSIWSEFLNPASMFVRLLSFSMGHIIWGYVKAKEDVVQIVKTVLYCNLSTRTCWTWNEFILSLSLKSNSL